MRHDTRIGYTPRMTTSTHVPGSETGPWMHTPKADYEALVQDRDHWKHETRMAEALAARWQERCKKAQATAEKLAEYVRDLSAKAGTTQQEIRRLLKDLNLG